MNATRGTPPIAAGLLFAVVATTDARAQPRAPGAPGAKDEPAPDDQPERAADEATTPLPRKTQISFKPAYTFPDGADRFKAEVLFEATLPYHGVFIPDLDAHGFWSIARLQLPAQSQQVGLTASAGLSDLSLADLAAHDLGPLKVGLGFASVFPMATDPALGQGKWQLGPALGVRLPGHALRLAVLVENLYSVAGDSQSAELAYVSVEPFVTLHLPADCFLSSDATMNFYWNGGHSTVPVDLGVGRAFSEHFVGQLQFWYTVAEADRGDIRVRAVLDFQP